MRRSKLMLRRTTVRVLAATHLRRAQGGTVEEGGLNTLYHCKPGGGNCSWDESGCVTNVTYDCGSAYSDQC